MNAHLREWDDPTGDLACTVPLWKHLANVQMVEYLLETYGDGSYTWVLKNGGQHTVRLKPCGTEAAYKRHIRRGERPCDPCSEANRLATWERTTGRKAS